VYVLSDLSRVLSAFLNDVGEGCGFVCGDGEPVFGLDCYPSGSAWGLVDT
jgi:hypothetical protein